MRVSNTTDKKTISERQILRLADFFFLFSIESRRERANVSKFGRRPSLYLDLRICRQSRQQCKEHAIVCLPARRAEFLNMSTANGVVIGHAVWRTFQVSLSLGEGQMSSAAAFEHPSADINHLLAYVC